MALEVCNNGRSAYDKDGNMLSLDGEGVEACAGII